MIEKHNIIGFYASGPALYHDASQQTKDIAIELGKSFQTYIWGGKGLTISLNKLKHETYGQDLVLILFQFYLNPLPYELEHIKEIESYRKKEKSIGIPIIINDENFFNKNEDDRYVFLKSIILQKIDLLSNIIVKKKLDTNIVLLKKDIELAFANMSYEL